MPRFPNPIRLLIFAIGLALSRVGLVSRKNVRRTTDLAWPRIVTGLARMSKNAVDVAFVGIAVGPVAIAGVGFATPYWGVAFSLGGGFAGGTIALVSQRYGAEAFDELGRAIRSSVALVLAVSLPVAVVFGLFPAELVSVMTDDEAAIGFGASYLRILSVGVPFAGLNLVGSRIYIGADDAWTPMLVRTGGALANILLSAAFVFGLGMGVEGAALGTVLANVVVTVGFAVGLVAGRLPGGGELPIRVDPFADYLDAETLRRLVRIGLPVVGRNLVWTVAKFPMLAIVALFGPSVVAAYVISRRVWGLMNTPGWGFGLASSSLVGQELGGGDERAAETYARDVIVFSVATYAVAAVVVFLLAEPIVLSFGGDPADPSVPVAVSLVYAACVAVVAQGIKGAAAGPLDASGDTRWPFYSQIIGMFGCAIPLAYLGAVTSLGLAGLYLSFVAEAAVPAAINYRRFSTGKWKAISREFRPGGSVADD
ncbi:MATE family efflux transporter [Haladaptatus salinisoli]|uniref:MATE family efflux transporter n=1 Tax=Haladaptatus salinisoli TaxID=2884876 RepID=UPI001D0A1243|nr:MATE family efflux transporter [Haladaptatus salinisoli]